MTTDRNSVLPLCFCARSASDPTVLWERWPDDPILRREKSSLARPPMLPLTELQAGELGQAEL